MESADKYSELWRHPYHNDSSSYDVSECSLVNVTVVDLEVKGLKTFPFTSLVTINPCQKWFK